MTQPENAAWGLSAFCNTGAHSGCRKAATCACSCHTAVISTRRKAPSGVVHEMAERGVGTLCGRDLPDPWQWTDESTTCRRCLAREVVTDA